MLGTRGRLSLAYVWNSSSIDRLRVRRATRLTSAAPQHVHKRSLTDKLKDDASSAMPATRSGAVSGTTFIDYAAKRLSPLSLEGGHLVQLKQTAVWQTSELLITHGRLLVAPSSSDRVLRYHRKGADSS